MKKARLSRVLRDVRLREREAAELHDSIVQRLTAAKWALEAGDHDGGMNALSETIEVAQALVAALLRGEPLSDVHRERDLLSLDTRTAVPLPSGTSSRLR